MTQRASFPQYLNLIAAVLIGALLRWMMLGHGLWRDEASSYFDAIGGTWGTVTSRVAYSELNPPGYFLFMHYWLKCIPVSDIVLKLPSLVASLLLVPLAWAIGRYAGGWRVSVVAAWIAALAPMDLYYTQEARPYMMGAMFMLLALLGIFELIEKPMSARGVVFFGIGTIGVLLMQYTGGLFDIALFAAWSYVRAKGWMRTPLAPVFFIALVLLTMVAYMLPAVINQVQAGLSWSEHISLLHYPEVGLRDILVTLPLDWFPVHEIFKAIFLLLVLIDGVWTWKTQPSVEYPGGRNAALLIFVLLAVAVLEIPISNHGRYMVPFAPMAWICIAAWLICGFCANERRRQVGMYASIALIVAMALFDLQSLQRNMGTLKSGAARLVDLHGQSGLNPKDWGRADTRVMVAPDLLAPTVAYYLRDFQPMIYGYARWQNPQSFSPLGYAELWNSTDSVLMAEQHIDTLRVAGVKHLILISTQMEHSGAVDFERNNELVKYLHAHYHSGGVVTLQGSIETFDVENLLL
jgi:hypothetical protein